MSSQRVSPQKSKELQDQGYIYVDVRSEQEFSAGHPKDAVNIPIFHKKPEGMTPNPEFIAVFLANFPKDTPLIIGCLSGKRSANAILQLEKAGYQNLSDQYSGFGGIKNFSGEVLEEGWVGCGLPTSSEGGTYASLQKKLSQ